MDRHPHILVDGTSTAAPYTSTAAGGERREYRHPPRDRVPHADKLTADINRAADEATLHANSVPGGVVIEGIALECISSASDTLEAHKLDDRNSKLELLSTRSEGGRTFATVFVPDGKLKNFLAKVDRYKTQNDQRRKDKGPKNKDLVESIESVQLPVVKSFWTDSEAEFPTGVEEKIWWEVWQRVPHDASDVARSAFRTEAERVGIILDERVVTFPERSVLLAYGSVDQWSGSLSLLGDVAELRRAKELPTDYVELPARDMPAFVADGAERIDPPTMEAPAVCLLDTGVHGAHPLLEPALDPADIHAVEPDWTTADDVGHGTEMAGIALFGGGLAGHLSGDERIELRHRLESVKLIHPTQENDPANYGAVTTQALAMAESATPDRSRVACLAVTSDDRDLGFPSAWSGAVDQHSSGALDDQRRLYVVSAGNIREIPLLAGNYPELNRKERGIEDPAQAWNALTVGAYTDLGVIKSPEFAYHSPVAPLGALCPTSRTSMMWESGDWPLKPDIVMEGGNYVAQGSGEMFPCDDLRLLTTTMKPTGRLLETMADTSAAAAQAAGLGASLMASYPALWPETIRALLVHSAEWNERMCAEFPSSSKKNIRDRLRCYGYGVPSATRAFWTVQNAVTLIAEEAIQPFEKVDSKCKTRDCHFHELPWPSEVLESLGNEQVTVRITLSYFVEPSPGRRGWTRKFRYASHGLRFAVRGALEGDEAFMKRITKEEWSEGEVAKEETRPDTSEPQNWVVGPKGRARGSIHSDWWTAPAVEVARSGHIAVYPVTGWWRERPHLGRVDRETRYSLVVTITTPEQSTDLLTPIRQVIRVPT